MGIRGFVSRIKFNVKQAAPDIFVVAGIAAGIAAIVDFCVKTRDAIPVVDKYKENMDKIFCAREDAQQPESVVTYDEKTFRKDVIDETLKTGGKLALIYARPIAIEAVSVGFILSGHHILKERNVAVAAAYAGVASELKQLHEEIKKRFGEDIDYELKHGIHSEEVVAHAVDEKTGNDIVEKKSIPVCRRSKNDPNYYSQYARFFDETCPGWTDDPEINLCVLKEIETNANILLRRRGYLFLNEVYDMAGWERSKAGQIVGWKYYKNGDNPYGDNYVSFGLDNVEKPSMRDFVNGLNPIVLVDFNVDGTIINSLPR